MKLRRFTNPNASVLAVVILFFVVAVNAADRRHPDQPQAKCSRSCAAQNCNSIGIRYGKYCGVGWTGCPGEEPCDELDACCKIHDECVGKNGMASVKCHESFKRCIKRIRRKNTAGFSRDCPYEVAMPTMIQGMDMAILFSQLGSSKYDL
ncbi:putative phospholipase A2 homolog 1 [Wolffia australiana]